MSNIRYYNQSAPVWDFIASLEEQGANHPFFSAFSPFNEDGLLGGWGGPRRGGWGGGGGRHGGGRGRHGRSPDHHGPASGFPHGPPHEHPHGPPHEHPHGAPPGPPHKPGHEGNGPSHEPMHRHKGPHHGSPDERRSTPDDQDEDPTIQNHDFTPAGSPRPRSPPPRNCGNVEHEEHESRGFRDRRGRGRGGHGGPRGFDSGGHFNLAGLADFFQSQVFGDVAKRGKTDHATNVEATAGDFVPVVDVFDTETAFVVHVSLAGANKEKDDVTVNWDHEKSELSISGVIHRPGDEDFLKTLALDERRVGAFSRTVRLGSRANPAHVDADGITARLEDGLLRINVPKEDKDYIEVKMIDVE